MATRTTSSGLSGSSRILLMLALLYQVSFWDSELEEQDVIMINTNNKYVQAFINNTLLSKKLLQYTIICRSSIKS